MKKIYMTFALLFVGLWAMGQSPSFSGGTGTSGDPYLISSVSDLLDLSQVTTTTYLTAYYEQTTDISFDSDSTNVDWDDNGTANWDTEDQKGFSPIGADASNSGAQFTGSYDGNGYTISNLFIDRDNDQNVGLFGHIGIGAKISNLHLENADVTGQRGTGSLVGRVTGDETTVIEECSATGTVEGTGATGGLVGSNNSYQTNPGNADGFRPKILRSYADVSVSNRTLASANDKIGGLAGCNQKGFISNSYARGSVTVVDQSERVGGLAGCVLYRGVIVNSYATGKVSVVSSGSIISNRIGGLLGYEGTGKDAGTVSNSFYNTDSISYTSSSGLGTGKNTADMQAKTTFTSAGWDFTTVWDIDGGTNDGYPFLRGTYTPPGTWTWKTDASSSDWGTNTNWKNDPTESPKDTAIVIIPTGINGSHPTLSSNAIVYDIEIGDGSTLTIEDGYTLTVINEATGSGSIVGKGEFVFAGSNPQDIPGFTFDTLKIDNLNNVKLKDNITVNGILTLSNGYLDLNGKTLTLGENATIIGEVNDHRIVGQSGTVVTTRTLDANTSYTLGNIGIELDLTSSTTLGETTIIRGHNAQTGNGNESISRWFDITPATTTGLDVDITFYYFTSELYEVDNESTLQLWRSDDDGSTWESVSSSVNTNDNKITAGNITTFSRLTAANEDNILPVNFLEFSGKRLDHSSIKLHWVTASEINNDRFEIQRSSNGEEFSFIGSVNGSGNTNQVVSYEFSDNEASGDVYYYRLKQVDYDGQYEYSKTIVISGNDNEQEIELFPNPATTEVTLMLAESLSIDKTLEIYNSLGQKMQTVILPAGIQQHTLELSSDLPEGVYYIKIEGESQSGQTLMIR